MSNTTITFSVRVNGVAVDPDTIVFRDAGGTYGVKRQDTDASVVAIDTALNQLSTGNYAYTFTDPAANLTYLYGVQWTYNGETYDYSGTVEGGTTSSNNLYDLLPRVEPYLHGCPKPVIKQNLRIALREFARDTWAIRENVSVTTVSGQTQYTISSTYDAQVLRVQAVKQGDAFLHFYTEDAANVIKLTGEPEAGISLTVKCVLLPDEDATGVPDVVISQWGDGIAYGCLYYLYTMERTPWYSPKNAEMYQRRFWNEMARAKRAIASDYNDDQQSRTEYVL